MLKILIYILASLAILALIYLGLTWWLALALADALGNLILEISTHATDH